MSRGVISLDCDGVLLDFIGGICWWLEEEYPGIQVTHGNFTKWSTEECLGLDTATAQRMWEATFAMNLLPVRGADLMVDTLRSRGYQIKVVTARDELGWEMAKDDLWYNFHISPDDILFTQDKNIGLRDIHALAHVDDKWKTAESVGRMWEGEGKVSYLIDRPWNHGLDLTARYKRIHSYFEVLNDWE